MPKPAGTGTGADTEMASLGALGAGAGSVARHEAPSSAMLYSSLKSTDVSVISGYLLPRPRARRKIG